MLREDALARLEELRHHKEQLLSSEPVRARLDRQRCVFKPSPAAARFELPPDFYNLTVEELRREQRLRWVPLGGGWDCQPPASCSQCLSLKDRSSGEGFHAEDKSHAREGRAKGNAEVQLHPAPGPLSRWISPPR